MKRRGSCADVLLFGRPIVQVLRRCCKTDGSHTPEHERALRYIRQHTRCLDSVKASLASADGLPWWEGHADWRMLRGSQPPLISARILDRVRDLAMNTTAWSISASIVSWLGKRSLRRTPRRKKQAARSCRVFPLLVMNRSEAIFVADLLSFHLHSSTFLGPER